MSIPHIVSIVWRNVRRSYEAILAITQTDNASHSAQAGPTQVEAIPAQRRSFAEPRWSGRRSAARLELRTTSYAIVTCRETPWSLLIVCV